MVERYAARYREIREVGTGSYAVAVLVESVPDRRKFVAKKIQLGLLKDKERKAVLAEAQILRTVKHFNVVSYEDCFMSETQLVILLEFCEGGDLAQTLQASSQPLPEAQVLSWLAQMALALNYLHRKHILHRDIKPSNIYLTANSTVKLGDFGIAKVLDGSADVAYSLAGTPNYISPEVVKNQPYSKKSDVWALGCVLYEMCTRRRAFSARNIVSLMGTIVKDEPSPITELYSEGVKKLVQDMLKKDVDKRASLEEVLRSPVLFPYLRKLSKARGAELSSLSQSKSFVRESSEAVRLTQWNPLDTLEDADEPMVKVRFSLAAELPSDHCAQPADEKTPLERLYTECESQLGQALFRRVYSYLRTQRDAAVDEDLVYDGLVAFVPQKLVLACYEVDKLLYWERRKP